MSRERAPDGLDLKDLRIAKWIVRCHAPALRERFEQGMKYAVAREVHDARRRGRVALIGHVLSAVLKAFAGRGEDGFRTIFRRRRIDRWLVEMSLAGRRLRRSPGFTFASVLNLGLGIGSATAMFSVVDGVLLRPLAYPDADRLLAVHHTAIGAGFDELGQSLGTYVHYREFNDVFEAFTAYRATSVTLETTEGVDRIPAGQVTEDFFEIFLSEEPLLGRIFSDGDHVPGSAEVIVLGEGLWRDRFGSDPSIVGRSVRVDGVARRVIGVVSHGVDIPTSETRVWLPERIDLATVRLGGFGRTGVGRVRPNVTVQQVELDLTDLIVSMEGRFNAVAYGLLVTGGGLAPRLEPLEEFVVGEVRGRLWILFGSILFLLMIAGVNEVQLLMVRADRHRHDLSIRSALGAQRSDIGRHHLTECLFLGALAGAVSIGIALLGVGWLRRWAADALPRLHEVTIDGRALLFAALLSMSVAVMLGLLLTLRSTLKGSNSTRIDGRATTAGKSRMRGRDGMVVVQVALSLVLMVGAGLMVRTFMNLRRVDLGFEPASSLVFRIGVPDALYPEPEEALRFHERVLDELRALPGVESVGATACLPLGGCDFRTPVYAEGVAFEPGLVPPSVDVRGVTAGFFEAIGAPILEGRALDSSDAVRAPPVALVSENLARRQWPGESAIGKRIHPDVPDEEPYTVVGVVSDIVSYGLDEPPPELLWVQFLGTYSYVAPPHTLTYVVRTRTEPLALTPTVRAVVAGMDPSIALSGVEAWSDVMDRAAAPTEFTMLLLLGSGAVSLFLGLMGVYALLSQVVNGRTREIGIRLALGAESGRIRRGIQLRGMVWVGAGLVIGLLGAYVGTRWMRSILFEVSPTDPTTLTAVTTTLFLCASLAIWIPARRASKIAPRSALRLE